MSQGPKRKESPEELAFIKEFQDEIRREVEGRRRLARERGELLDPYTFPEYVPARKDMD